MGKWLDMAKREETPPRADSVFSAVSPAQRPNDTKDTNGTLRFSPAQRLREWHAKLEPLAELPAPDGIDPARWRELVCDSWWVYERFCSQAVRDGWSALDLFGVLPWKPSLGGLVARLGGARNLKMAGQKAVWSSWGVPDWTCIGGGDDLATSGIVLLWELGR